MVTAHPRHPPECEMFPVACATRFQSNVTPSPHTYWRTCGLFEVSTRSSHTLPAFGEVNNDRSGSVFPVGVLPCDIPEVCDRRNAFSRAERRTLSSSTSFFVHSVSTHRRVAVIVALYPGYQAVVVRVTVLHTRGVAQSRSAVVY